MQSNLNDNRLLKPAPRQFIGLVTGFFFNRQFATIFESRGIILDLKLIDKSKI